jgi:predicted regulator of Ras-like GTPase activity (Roadblock/LC7/MglB family)
MLKFLKKLFTKNGGNANTQNASTAVAETHISKPTDAKSGVDVASLSLRAILEKLPADLKSSVDQMPGSDVKVVLPVAAIMKQLPSGAVRMSLASLYRQAPSGTFRKTNVEDKRLVDVPLSEVFKTINPTALKRRDNQRRYDVPEDAVGLFDGDSSRNVSAPGQSSPAPAPAPAPKAKTPPTEQKLRMPAPTPTAPATYATNQSAPAPAASAPAAPREAATPLNLTSELSLLLVEVAAGWQEGYRNELSVLPGDTRLSLPASEVGPLLQKGKVAFPWETLRRWLTPPPSSALNIPDDTQLVLPLKIVAPAFVAATGAKKRASQGDASLPDFFGPSAGQTPAQKAAPAPAPAPVAPARTAAPAPAAKSLPPASVAAAAPASAPVITHDSAGAPAGRMPMTLRELFKMPDKTDWPPNELVKLTCALPGVAGVVVALEEGLVVAQKLPDGFSADTFAAFMPQVFSRMDRYTGEMQLGETNDVTLNTESGAVRLFRNGKVFVAALGTSGEFLPNGLHLICNELASQNS